FMCLLHEKPFAGINGSGKHVNWSVGNATQGNLLDPGTSPEENLQFLVFCGAVIRGVHLYGPLLRAVIATASNDHRLGANEAPPAILSVYLGDQLEAVYADIEAGKVSASSDGGIMDLGLSQILPFTRDPGDRNRTSPFAFTGNRFEFRAVGSSQSVSGPLVAMNTMLADSLDWIAAKLETELGAGKELPEAVATVLQEVMELHGNAVFGGDGYSSEWHEAAVKERGLRNLPTSADALPVFTEQAVIDLFTSTGVLSAVELNSRYEVYAEQYINSVLVEAKLVMDLGKTVIYPAALGYLAELSATYAAVPALDTGVVDAIAANANGLMSTITELGAELEKHDFADTAEHMQHVATSIRGLMDQARVYADALEVDVADKAWPLPKYREMLFIR
ncbi:MAG: glutamine synthetase type III, partial [Actinomycetales bacterium]